MRFYQKKIDRLHYHRKGEQLRTNVSFEQYSKLQFTAVQYNISRKEVIVWSYMQQICIF